MGIYVVTGGASGIGAAVKKQLLAEGHTVYVVDLNDADVNADLCAPDGRAQAVKAIQALAPDGIDGFIPCAGVGSDVKPPSLIAKINYFGVLATVEGLKDDIARKKGAIVLISSISATMAADAACIDAMLAVEEDDAADKLDALGDGFNAYGGAKQALARWMRKNCADYLAAGIRMNAVAPGYIDTPLNEKIEEDPELRELNQAFAASIPLGRRGRPEDIANVVCFLLSPQAAFMAGTVILVDGGHDAMLRPDQF